MDRVQSMDDAEFREMVVEFMREIRVSRSEANDIIEANRCRDAPLQRALIAFGDAMQDVNLRNALIEIGTAFRDPEVRDEMVSVAQDRIRARERREWMESQRAYWTRWGTTIVLISAVSGILFAVFKYGVRAAGGGQ